MFKHREIHFCMPTCPYLKPNEEYQSKEKEPHICELFHKRVYHSGSHPEIYKCNECNNLIGR